MKIITLFIAVFLSISLATAADPIRVIVFGAHPDDCDIKAGGTAALYARLGHKVKFVSLTNGNKGHHTMKPDELVVRRKKEMQKAAHILGITYENMNNDDGELMPTLENRKAVIKMICDWKADIVITHRPNDYHPDHRYTSAIVQDAAYMISVPQMVPDGDPLLKPPVFLYMSDGFRKPSLFSPDIVIDITPVAGKKADAICAHESQVYEWLPWNGGWEKDLPSDPVERHKYVSDRYMARNNVDIFKDAARNWYTAGQLENIRYLEAFEICEYGSQPDKEKIRQLFPMLP